MSTVSANTTEMQTDSLTNTDYDLALEFLMSLDISAYENNTENYVSHNIDQITSMQEISNLNIIADDADTNIIDTNTHAITPIIFKTKVEMTEYISNTSIYRPFMVHTEYPYRQFLLFRSDDEFIDYANNQPVDQRCFHEVIIGNPRTVTVDIDDDSLEISEWRKFGSECATKFVIAFNDYYSELAYITYDDIVIIDSSGFSRKKNKNKFSCQIRTRMYTTTWRENHEFAKFFAAMLSRNGVVDFGIYTDYHCMRIPGSTKKDDGRNSRIMGDASIKSSWIGYNRDCIGIPLPKLLEPETANEQLVETSITDATVKKVLEIAAPHTIGYKFRENKGALILFSRDGMPNECPICLRTHAEDNGALYIVIKNNDIMQCCMREKDRIRNHPELTENRIKIGELSAGEVNHTVLKPKKLSAEERCEYLINKPRPVSDHKYHGYDYVVYNEPTMRPYPTARTLVVHAAKGIGKTEELVRHITSNYDNCRIIALSHRETFAAELARQLPGFNLYNKLAKGRISIYNNPRVIVQMESLCRLDMMEVIDMQIPIDLLIIDESESIIAQLSSPLYKNFNESWAAFDYLVRYSAHVIALDAHTSGRTIDLLRVREFEPDHIGTYVRNEYVRNEYKYYITPDSNKWETQLFQDLDAGKKIVIPMNSATGADKLGETIRKRYPTRTVLVYTAKTDRKDKFADIEQINEKWIVDVLIYSPTITSGVSFKLKHFDRIYGYFRNGSAGAMECDQMLGRVRDIGDKCGYMYIDPRNTECMVNRTQLREQVLNARNHLYAQYDMTNLAFTYTPAGRQIQNENYFELWLDNTLIMNKSRARFMGEMIDIFHTNGIALELLRIEPNMEIVCEIQEVGKIINQEKRMLIQNAAVITQERAEEIKNTIDTTAEERAQLHKYRLSKLYDVSADVITADWCKIYDTVDSIRWYKSLRAITTQTLEQIQTNEREHVEKYESEAQCWNMKTHYDKHRIANEVLRICGFESVRDTSSICKDTLVRAMAQYGDKLNGEWSHMQSTFRIRAKKPNFKTDSIKVIMGVFNSILYGWYGIKIITTGKGTAARNNYKIFHYHDFDRATFRPVVPEPPVPAADPAVEAFLAEIM